MTDKIRILFLASEAAPFIKVGGLGDVAGSLPSALAKLQASDSADPLLEIRVVLPLHDQINRDQFSLSPVVDFHVPAETGIIKTEVHQAQLHGISHYFISSPGISFAEPIYSTDTAVDGFKYAFFSLAAIQLAKEIDFQFDILHANDWHTAAAVIRLDELRKYDLFYRNTRSLLTIHNLPYLGLGAEEAMGKLSLIPSEDNGLPDWASNSPLPLGMVAADQINTVSQGYAGEILTEEFGSGLHEYLTTIKDHISGILNGLDTDAWDPSKDKMIFHNYKNSSLTDRRINKTALQNELGLPASLRTPLISMINRMDYQKGVDLIPPALRMVSDLDWQAVILGTGDPMIEEEARRLELEFPGRIRTIIEFDAALARRIYAGSDMILIPSRYEPCGLAQMIGMRYGCVPIARATGGLKDTITTHSNLVKGTGFLFGPAESGPLADTIRYALNVYNDQRRWRGIQLRGMKQDFSWERSAMEYFILYERILTR